MSPPLKELQLQTNMMVLQSSGDSEISFNSGECEFKTWLSPKNEHASSASFTTDRSFSFGFIKDGAYKFCSLDFVSLHVRRAYDAAACSMPRNS
mmetsp:Transcript_14841/g.21508  ORF Transcript_14841/g.21508 Transcript_14841/m.21508 type:complete len:94 (-) Transcript_14841:216-497(-)